MKKIIYLLVIFSLSLASCQKAQTRRFEGTYSNSDNTCNPSIIISKYDNASIAFDYKFGCFYVTNLKANVSNSKKATIEPLAGIGVVSQGGYEVFGGSVERDNDKLTVTIDNVHYCDQNDPNLGCLSERITEVFIYTKD